MQYLDFEKNIPEIDKRIEEVKYSAMTKETDRATELDRLNAKKQKILTSLYKNLSAWQKAAVALPYRVHIPVRHRVKIEIVQPVHHPVAVLKQQKQAVSVPLHRPARPVFPLLIGCVQAGSEICFQTVHKKSLLPAVYAAGGRSGTCPAQAQVNAGRSMIP